MGEIQARCEGAVLQLQLRHPGRANAIDGAMLRALDAHIDAIEADASVRVVVLRGTPGGTFSAGADIREWGALSPEAFAHDWIDHGNRVFDRLERLRCPTIAAIEGACFGGGLELALCCDLRVGSEAARLCFPELGLGAFPGWRGGARLAHVAGRGRALQAILTGDAIDAGCARDWGVLNAVWPPEAFERELAALTQRLLAAPPFAASVAKAAILAGAMSFDYGDAARRVRAHPHAEEGLRAYHGRRRAAFETVEE